MVLKFTTYTIGHSIVRLLPGPKANPKITEKDDNGQATIK